MFHIENSSKSLVSTNSTIAAAIMVLDKAIAKVLIIVHSSQFTVHSLRFC